MRGTLRDPRRSLLRRGSDCFFSERARRGPRAALPPSIVIRALLRAKGEAGSENGVVEGKDGVRVFSRTEGETGVGSRVLQHTSSTTKGEAGIETEVVEGKDGLRVFSRAEGET